jgi:hypothetical protein
LLPAFEAHLRAFVIHRPIGSIFCAVCDGPQVTSATSSKEELLGFYKQMYTIRRMEIAADNDYKVCMVLLHRRPCKVTHCGLCRPAISEGFATFMMGRKPLLSGCKQH